MTFEAPIFIPSGKIKRDVGTTIIYVMWVLIFAILIPSAIFNFPEGLQHFLNIFIYLGIGIWMIIITSNFFRYEPLNGEIKGKVKMNDTKITFGDRVIEFNDIIDFNFDKYFDFNFMDYYSRGHYNYRGLEPYLSQGVNNAIHIKTKEDITINFRLENKEHGMELKPFVRMLALKNKMPLIRAISLLKLNYKEVEALKAEIAKEQA